MASANIVKDVRKLKEQLRYRAYRKGGVYENFGQKEYHTLLDKWNNYKGKFSEVTDKVIDTQLQEFYKWCISRDDKNIKSME